MPLHPVVRGKGWWVETGFQRSRGGPTKTVVRPSGWAQTIGWPAVGLGVLEPVHARIGAVELQ